MNKKKENCVGQSSFDNLIFLLTNIYVLYNDFMEIYEILDIKN